MGADWKAYCQQIRYSQQTPNACCKLPQPVACNHSRIHLPDHLAYLVDSESWRSELQFNESQLQKSRDLKAFDLSEEFEKASQYADCH